MSTLTQTTRLNIGYWQGSPTISRNAETTETIIQVSNPYTDNSGAVVTGNFIMGIATRSGIETVYIPANAVSADGLTLGTSSIPVVRGLQPYCTTDFTTATSTFAQKLTKGDRVFIAIDTALLSMLQEATLGTIGTNIKFATRPTYMAAAPAACPIFPSAAVRDGILTSPQNGDMCYLSAEGIFTDYTGGVWATRATGTIVNASTTAAGKVQEAVSTDIATSTTTGSSGARLYINPASTKDTRTTSESILVRTQAVDGCIDGSFIRQGVGALTGEIRIWTIAIAPAGWLVADGSALSRTTYSTLFGVIGTTYGAGDGTTTFNLPDLRGNDGTRGISLFTLHQNIHSARVY